MKEFSRNIDRTFYRFLTSRQNGKFDRHNIRELSSHYLDLIGVKPVFESEQELRFSEERKMLNKEGVGGLIISNHPSCSRADTMSILFASNRKDIKLYIRGGW